MDKDYVIETVETVSVCRFTRQASMREIREGIEAQLQTGAGPLRLYDFSAGLQALSMDQVCSLAEYSKSLPTAPGSKVAIVAPDDLSFGLARMFEVYREDGVLQNTVFRNFEEAIAWLREFD